MVDALTPSSIDAQRRRRSDVGTGDAITCGRACVGGGPTPLRHGRRWRLGGGSAEWAGGLPAGASPKGENTCVEGVNCETFTLTLAGTPADWHGNDSRQR